MKSRSLFSAAFAAVLIGGVVLAPSVALAQRRDRDNSRSQRSTNVNRDRNQNRNNNSRSDNNRWSNRRDNNTSSQDRYQDHNRDNNNQWNQDHNRDNDQWNRDHNRDNNHDRDNNRWDRDHNRDHDYNWRDPDHDGDIDIHRRRTVVRYYYPSYGYSSYGSSYGYSNDRGSEWRDIAQAAGLLAVLGLLDHDDTLFFIGALGALYSIDRYDHDRYSRDPECRLRAEFFSHPYFYRDGRRYDRETVNRDGDRYYRFVCR